MTNLHQVSTANLPIIVARLDRINRKAEKLGVAPVSLNVVEEKVRVEWTEAGTRIRVPTTVFELVGEAPKVAGYTLVARLDHEVAGNLIMSVPGQTLPERFRDAPAVCEHCAKARARKQTFVFQAEDGSYIQVGSTCLVDFFGHKPESILWFASAMDGEWDEDEGWYGSAKAVRSVSALHALEVASACIREYGWTSSTEAKQSMVPVTSTADHVWSQCFPPVDQRRFKLLELDAQDAKVAAEALAWAESREVRSDYDHNLKVALAQPVTRKNLGIVVSAVSAYHRHLEQETKRRLQAEQVAGSVHLGTVGGKVSATVTVTGLRYLDSVYGATTIVSMVDEQGNVIKWFASNDPTVEVGQRFQVAGTVKKHGEYNGVNETVLTRCKMVPA